MADACGLVNVVGGLALLWAEIDLAEGKTSSAASWLGTARDKFAQDDDEDGLPTRPICSTHCEHPQGDHVDIEWLIELILAPGRNWLGWQSVVRAEGLEPSWAV